MKLKNFTAIKELSSINTGEPILWLDAALGVNGGTAINGHAVHEWADQSGHGSNFVQTTASWQPIYNTATGINGLPTLTFAPNKRLQLLNTILFCKEYTIYAVVKTGAITQTGTTDYKTFFMFSTCGWYCQTLGRVGLSYHNPNDPTPLGTDFLYDDRIGRTPVIPYDTNAHYFTISNGDVLGTNKKQVYADGVQYVDGTGGINSSLGLVHFLGSWNNSLGQFEFAELIIYDFKHTDTQREEVELYLKNKYGL